MGNKLINTTSVKLGIYEESTDSQLEGMLGDKKEWEGGRLFRLCSNGETALTAGVRVQSVAVDSADDELLVYSAAAAGQKDIIITVTAGHGTHAAHLLKDAYLVVNKGTDCIGTFYKIKDNTIMTASSTATITLYDKLTVALAANDEVTICVNPFKAVIKDVLTAPVAGVPLINVTASDSDTTYYFWALVEGYGPAIASGTVTVGDYVERVTAGVVQTYVTAAEAPIAIAYSTNATGEALIVKYL